MISLQDILDDDKEQAPIEEPISDSPSLESLEKTASYFKSLSQPDREIDVAAKQAVIQDLIKEAGWIPKWIPRTAKGAADKAVKAGHNKVYVAKANAKAEKLVAEAEAISRGEKVTMDTSKALTLGAVGAAGVAGGYMYANKDKDSELKAIAQKYYQAGMVGQ